MLDIRLRNMAHCRSIKWSTEEELPSVPIGDIIEIMADGDEWEYIRARFRNIPCTIAPVQLWTGETAQYIYANLRLCI